MHEILKCFPEGKHKVLTMSYDDGSISDRRLVEIFNKYGIKGTFHLNSGLLDKHNRISRNEVKELYKGHEVATHTLTHPTILECFLFLKLLLVILCFYLLDGIDFSKS